MATLPEFLEDAIDLHVHSAPDVDARRFNDLELAREAERVGMAAILIKSHQNSTVERAWLVSKVVTGIQVFGGLVLNETVGGLNVAAVKLALAMGAKEIWMPTRSAHNHRLYHGEEGGISVLDASGALVPEARAILEAVAQSGGMVSTGHLGPREATILIREAHQCGVRKVLVTHPGVGADVLSNITQKELALLGNVWFERCFVSTTHLCGCVPFGVIEQAIVEVGVDTTVLSTDLGQPQTPPPAEGLRLYAEQLKSSGFSFEQIRRMMCSNPADLLSSGRGRRSLKTFKGALIGCGFFSRHHQEAWRRVRDAEIVAACDLSLERARAAAPRAYTSVEEMLKVEDLDFVDIATRSTVHLELISLAAERGLAIICQKPMAPDWATACRMVEISDGMASGS